MILIFLVFPEKIELLKSYVNETHFHFCFHTKCIVQTNTSSVNQYFPFLASDDKPTRRNDIPFLSGSPMIGQLYDGKTDQILYGPLLWKKRKHGIVKEIEVDDEPEIYPIIDDHTTSTTQQVYNCV